MERITQEIVASARKILGPKSQIEIRPLMHASGSAAQFADAIYMSTSSASQTRSLEDAMGRVARRHDLSIARSASDGVVVLDFSSRGIPTHSIHIVTPLTFEYGSSASRGPRLAIIVDDMGYDRAAVHSVLALPFRVTVSVIPHLPLSAEVAEEAFRRGDEVILHLPMQSVPSAAQQERIELRVGMNAQQVQSILAGMLETVPHVVGVNNHEGSLATADPALMNELMPDLRARGLFFIDSRTTAATVAYTAAEQAGVRAAARKVFLDDTVTVSAVRKQIELAARDAEKNGSAISIGHPHPATIAALAATVPQLEKCGIRLVFASDLVH
ncbi:MAG TPA: divergent polysaccharide deacetylase family protein [Candidatus Acidoferrum sp.]|nr:divergent polysaccharide deacetylase family protein [Candidatus Acidoferrum sp.]